MSSQDSSALFHTLSNWLQLKILVFFRLKSSTK